MKTFSPRRVAFAALAPVLLFAAGLFVRPAVSSPGPAAQIPQAKAPPGLKPVEESPDKPRTVTLDQVPPGALVPQGPAPTLAVLATGDVVGYLEPCG